MTDLLVVATRFDRQKGQWVAAVTTRFSTSAVRGMGDLKLPATLPRRRDASRLAASRLAACDTAAGHFHLGHRCRAMGPFEPRKAAREQLLRPQRGDDDEFVRVEMDWTDDHRVPLDRPW